MAPGLVLRPRLVKHLNGVLNHRLTLISAPAGFGKTTLLSQWIHESRNDGSTAWLSLEESENDPSGFWQYAIAALGTVRDGVGGMLQNALGSQQPPPIESVLSVLINELAAIPDDFVFVLDDYHVIHSEAINKGIAFLIDHLPPKMHLAISTRADPPLPLSRFRGKGMLLEIGADDLRFTSQEARVLLSELGLSGLTVLDIEALNTRAEGWVAGLKMAELSMRGEKNISTFVTGFTGSQRYIMDYLIEEVLQRQPPDVRDFLLKTSILKRLTGHLCDAVTNGTGGHEMLVRLERENLFLVPLDASMEWYRYHHLFADLLGHRLKAENGNEVVAGLHSKASNWYEGNGLLHEAIEHALAARDWEKAMDLISRPELNQLRWSSETMLRWLNGIPEEMLRTRMWLYFSLAWNLKFAGQFPAAEERLKYMEKAWESDEYVLGSVEALRGFMADDIGDSQAAEDHARKAVTLFRASERERWSPEDIERRAAASLLLGTICFRRLLFDEAESNLRESVEGFRKAGADPVHPLTVLAAIAATRGRVHEAISLYEETMDGPEADASPLACSLLGNIYCELNELDRAASWYERAVALYQQRPGVGGYDTTFFRLAIVKTLLGDDAGARTALEKADGVLRLLGGNDPGPNYRANSAAYHAAIALVRGDEADAFRWIDRLAELNKSIPLGTPAPVLRLLRLRKGAGFFQERDAGYEFARKQGMLGPMIVVRIDQALDSAGTDIGAQYMAEALKMARPEGYIRTFVDFGVQLLPLLREAISKGVEAEYARKLMGIIEAEERQRKISRGELPEASLSSGVLSEREIEVMKLVAEGLSNQQIADRLRISLSTAKTHVYHIFDKLDANDRLDAVSRAKEMRLI